MGNLNSGLSYLITTVPTWLNRFKSVAVIIAIIIAKCKHAKSRPDDDFACLLETQMSVPGLFYTLIEDTNQ